VREPVPAFDVWHVALPVTDLAAAEAFWCDGLGFRLVGRDEYPSKKQAFVAVRDGGFTVELFEPRGAAREAAPRRPDHLAFECVDLARYRAALAKRRLPGLPPIEEFDDGVRVLELADPDGMPVQFFQGRAIYEASIRGEGGVPAGRAEKPPSAGAVPAGPAAFLLAHALAYPGAYEDHPWGETVAKVKKKVFAFFGVPGAPGSWGVSVKLPRSGGAALERPFARPTGYGLGKSGWVSARFEAGDEAPLDVLRSWIDESYRAVAPKALVATLDGAAGTAPKPRAAPRARPAKRRARR
jgi:catechol 2,3-dioxygenase-like lactoylglutathione lyase family enzyme